MLTEKGKELATVELPYTRGDWKITDISGRTIHPDGTVIPLTGKPEDLLSEKVGERQIGRKVFTLPSVEVGSILEYRYNLRYDDNHFSSPSWEIQKPYFVHKAHYQFTPFKAFMSDNHQGMSSSNFLVDERGRAVNSLIWWKHLPDGVDIKTDVGGHYTVDVTDVPPAPDEEWMPPVQSYLYKVFFYYKAASDPSDFWISEAKLWSKDVDHFAEPTKAIHAAVDGLVAPSDSELDKAKKLYAAVEALDNTDYSRAKSASEMKQLKLKEAKRAEDTWTQKSGSSDDIALLYLAMLRAAGLTAYAMKVVDRDERHLRSQLHELRPARHHAGDSEQRRQRDDSRSGREDVPLRNPQLEALRGAGHPPKRTGAEHHVHAGAVVQRQPDHAQRGFYAGRSRRHHRHNVTLSWPARRRCAGGRGLWGTTRRSQEAV